MRIAVAAVLVCLVALPALSAGAPLSGGGHYAFDLGGGGQYVIDLDKDQNYYDIAEGVVPLIVPDGRVRSEVELVEGEGNTLYLADGQYLTLILPQGGGGQYRLQYTPRMHGYVLHVTPFGGGGQYGILVIPRGGGGQYSAHIVAKA